MNEISLLSLQARRKQVPIEEQEQVAAEIGFRKDYIADFQTELAGLLGNWPELD